MHPSCSRFTPNAFRKMPRPGTELVGNDCIVINPRCEIFRDEDLLLTVTETGVNTLRVSLSLPIFLEWRYLPNTREALSKQHSRLILSRQAGQSVVLRKRDNVSMADARDDLKESGIIVSLNDEDKSYPSLAFCAHPCWQILRSELTPFRYPRSG